MEGWVAARDLRNRGMLGMNARNLNYIGRYNKRSLYPLVDDKLQTKRLAEEYEIPVPKLLAAISQQHEVRGALDVLGDLTGFAMKPAKGSGGKGIWVIGGRDEDGFIKTSGARVTHADLRRHMSNTLAGLYSLAGSTDQVIIEDLIRPAPHFKELSHEGVPDIRVIVFRGYPVMAMLRLATHASDGKANLHQGAVGVGLNLEDGSFASAVQFDRFINLHPDTGRELAAIRIDGWREILELGAQCYEMTELGYLGTDIVIDEQQGPMLLELNARPGLAIQLANRRGLLPRLRAIEALPRRKIKSPADRVAFSMRTLAAL